MIAYIRGRLEYVDLEEGMAVLERAESVIRYCCPDGTWSSCHLPVKRYGSIPICR